MARRENDRRTDTSRLTTRSPSSPANLLIMAIVGVLAITAAAAAVMGSGYDDVTPHGQVLGELQTVADAQLRHYASTGTFAGWLRTLALPDASSEVRISIVRGNRTEWEAVAHHTIGLSCTQSGRVVDGVPRTDRPTCFVPQ